MAAACPGIRLLDEASCLRGTFPEKLGFMEFFKRSRGNSEFLMHGHTNLVELWKLHHSTTLICPLIQPRTHPSKLLFRSTPWRTTSRISRKSSLRCLRKIPWIILIRPKFCPYRAPVGFVWIMTPPPRHRAIRDEPIRFDVFWGNNSTILESVFSMVVYDDETVLQIGFIFMYDAIGS